MNFELYSFWKHKNCRDAFIFAAYIPHDDGKTAIINAHWMIQGCEHYWTGSKLQKIEIKEEEYKNWEPYWPKGDYKDV